MVFSIAYTNLMVSFDENQCPICSLVREKSRKHLQAVLYEFVNDAEMRGKLILWREFRNWHGWQALEIACSDTGVPVIYKDLLDRELHELV